MDEPKTSPGPGSESGEDIPLERDLFLRSLLRELAGTLEDVVGLEDAEGFVSVVGTTIGQQINGLYKEASGESRFDRERVARVLVDLKRRIEGGFYLISSDEKQIVLGNRRCPFGRHVEGRPSLCMMTSNVFGSIAADHLGYAAVTIEEAIARGDPGCRVVINLDPETAAPGGLEYFKA